MLLEKEKLVIHYLKKDTHNYKAGFKTEYTLTLMVQFGTRRSQLPNSTYIQPLYLMAYRRIFRKYVPSPK